MDKAGGRILQQAVGEISTHSNPRSIVDKTLAGLGYMMHYRPFLYKYVIGSLFFIFVPGVSIIAAVLIYNLVLHIY